MFFRSRSDQRLQITPSTSTKSQSPQNYTENLYNTSDPLLLGATSGCLGCTTPWNDAVLLTLVAGSGTDTHESD
jgi:hypothetical protein